MAEQEKRLLSVTMSADAAERFRAALTYAEAQIYPGETEPISEKGRIAYEHADWLRWGISRVTLAEQKIGERA